MLTLLHSAEVRWFLEKNRWEDCLEWFTKDHPTKSEGKRLDDYLLFPDCDSTGVKLRDGKKFEVKALVTPSRPLQLEGNVNGRTDQWVKWSFESKNLLPLKEELLASAVWVKVHKVRYLRKFSVVSGQMVEISPAEMPDSGCNVELTALQVGPEEVSARDMGFSIGFEAFGSSAEVAKILDDTLRLFFKAEVCGPAPVALNGGDSRSYPAWIATFARP